MQQEQFKKEILPLRGRLLTIAQRMLNNAADAEDVVQETLMKLWIMRDRLPEVQNTGGLSVRIVKNACLNRIKSLRHRSAQAVESTSLCPADTPHTRLEHRDSLEKTIRIVDGLPELQQAVLRMRHIDGLELDEIADLTGSTPEAVRMNLSRARRRVKEAFMKSER